MTKITAYNTLAKDSRIVAVFSVDSLNVTEALDQGQRIAARWNRDEKRQNMIVNFVSAEGMVRGL